MLRTAWDLVLGWWTRVYRAYDRARTPKPAVPLRDDQKN